MFPCPTSAFHLPLTVLAAGWAGRGPSQMAQEVSGSRALTMKLDQVSPCQGQRTSRRKRHGWGLSSVGLREKGGSKKDVASATFDVNILPILSPERGCTRSAYTSLRTQQPFCHQKSLLRVFLWALSLVTYSFGPHHVNQTTALPRLASLISSCPGLKPSIPSTGEIKNGKKSFRK